MNRALVREPVADTINAATEADLSERKGIQTGCGVLFALPFCAGGLMAAGVAVREWFTTGFELERAILLLVFALVFGGVGFGLLYATLSGRKRARRGDERRTAHPEAPWLWREEWNDGRVRCDAKKGALALSAFATLWMLISAPVAFVAVNEELPKGNKAALIALVFPAVGLLLMGWAGLAVLRWRKYGSSVFEMGEFPGVVGGDVVGGVHVAARVDAAQGVTMRLTCIERTVTGSGKNRRTHESVLWQDEMLLPAASLAVSRGATTIPVAFRVPFDCRQSEELSPSHSILWRLELDAETAGADYATSFEIPVFRTPESRPDASVSDALDLTPPEAPRDPRIRVHRSVGGRLELVFPAFRHPGLSLGLGTFLAVWWGIVVLLTRSDAPWLFPLVFGGFGLLIGFAWISVTFGASRAVADPEQLSVTPSWFGIPGPCRSMRAADVKRLRLKVGMQAGGARQTAYHDLIAELGGGRTLKVGSVVRSRREGEWLIARLNEALERDTA